MTNYLTEQDVLDLHDALVVEFADTDDPIDPPGPRDLNLVGSAIMRPQTSLGDVEKYHDTEAKAAALFHSLAKNHAFHNGNKRVALLGMLAFLERNGRRMVAQLNDDEVFGLVVGVADGSWPRVGATADEMVNEITNWVKHNSVARTTKVSTMRTQNFLDKCAMVGCRVIDASVSWRVQGQRSIVSIGKSTHQLSGNVVKAYLRKLGITQAGVTPDAFQEGVGDDIDLLLQFHNVLKRLAHA